MFVSGAGVGGEPGCVVGSRGKTRIPRWANTTFAVPFRIVDTALVNKTWGRTWSPAGIRSRTPIVRPTKYPTTIASTKHRTVVSCTFKTVYRQIVPPTSERYRNSDGSRDAGRVLLGRTADIHYYRPQLTGATRVPRISVC